MAGRGPRLDDGHRTTRAGAGPAPEASAARSLVRLSDLAGRPRGVGFLADHHGTVVTAHEAVDGLPRLVVHAADGRSCVVSADAVTPVPERDLALVRTDGLDAEPLPVTVRDRVEPGAYVRLVAGCWREARVLTAASVTYTAMDRSHLLDDVLELAIGTAGRDALRLGGGAAGGPVLDAATGAVVAVLGTALRSGHRDAGFAVPLRPAPADGPLADLLARNAATVPAYGADLNPAGVLELTATSVGSDGPAGPAARTPVPPVERAVTAREFAHFAAGPAAVLALVGAPGSGRTTELAALAARRARDPHPAPTLWLRGADLRETDTSIADAAHRALTRAARIVSASRPAAAFGPTASRPAAASGPAASHAAASGHAASHPAAAFGPTASRPAAAFGFAASHTAGPGPAVSQAAAFGQAVSHPAAASGPAAPRPASAFGPTASGSTASYPAAVSGPAASGPVASRPAAMSGYAASGPAVSGPAAASGPAASRPAAATYPAAASGPAAPHPAPDDPAPDDPGELTPELLAHLARAAGRPLLLLLDGPEEMPPAPADRLRDWADGTARWLRETGVRLVVACRAEYWEQAGARFPAELLYGRTTPALPPCVLLGDLTPAEAREARARHGVPDTDLAPADARHPLTLRLYAEVRAALPDAPGVPVDRDDVLAAHLDLMCLRVAVRLAAGNGLRGTAVRRLAAKVAGQVHEAARRSLGPGQGELDRASFEAVFPWGPAPARLGGGTGWASAVLAEGLLVPAGAGYRFAHEELADWIQGAHLDLDEALRVLVHRRRSPGGAHPLPVPHHRIGPVVQALLLLARQQGPHRLAVKLRELTAALQADPDSWWAARLLAETLLRVPDATPYIGVLRPLADLIAERRGRPERRPTEFAPDFWTALPLPTDTRLDLLRRLVLADAAPDAADAPRYLDAVARLLAADPLAVQPQLALWFDDERPLPATPHATVATAAQALLHTHRHAAPDDLAELLVDRAHPRADELLAVLAEEEPSALCRAVDRWAHDERPARRIAATAYAPRVAPHVRTAADRELLRHAALALSGPSHSTHADAGRGHPAWHP